MTGTALAQHYDIDVSPEEGRLIFHGKPGVVPVSVVRAMPGRKWDASISRHVMDAHIAVERLAREFSLSVSPEAQALIDHAREEQARQEAEVQAVIDRSHAQDHGTVSDEVGEIAFADKMRPYQRAGVAYAIDRYRTTGRGTLIGDEPGLGKTWQALAVLETMNAFPALVVCPPNLKLNWLKEINKLLPHRSVQVYYNRNRIKQLKMPADISIIGYPVLWSFLPNLPMLAGLVVDESHNAKNEKATRTKSLLQATGHMSYRDEDGNLHPIPSNLYPDAVRLLLSGTPVLNRPRELVWQLVMLGHLIPSPTVSREGTTAWFLNRYCPTRGSKTSKRKYRTVTNELELNNWLRLRMVRRTKADVLPELPPKITAPQWMELEPEAHAAYHEMAVLGAERASMSQAQALVYLNALREAIGIAKIPAAVSWCRDFLESGKQLVVFAHHKPVQNGIIKGLTSAGYNVSYILGGQSVHETERQKELFQSGKSQVMVCSLEAARYGHTLTAASDVLTVELGWNPATHTQASDRVHRLGQLDSVTSWYLLADYTIDYWIWTVIRDKGISIDAAVDGKIPDEDDLSVVAEVFDMAMAAYGGKVHAN